MALDRVNHRMFVPEPGNIRVLVYQLDENGRHVRHTADHVVGHRSLLGRRRQSEVNRNDGAGGAETGLAVHNVHQRLFVRDRNRILVFDIEPDVLEDYPAATLVIGQEDFETLTPGTSRRKFRGSELIVDDENQRLFVEDGERILVFDIHPDRLTTYPEAHTVIGQPDFESRLRGTGPNRLSRAHGLAFDPDEMRLFVSDQGNNRVLVFDVHPNRLTNDPSATAVLGQPDFETTTRRFVGAAAPPEERRGTRAMTPGGLDYDPKYQRLFVSQLADNRILVFDAAPDRLQHDPEAIAVLGQPDFTTFDPRVSRSNFVFPKDPSVDPDAQILYVSEGFPGGNRVIAFDISPENLRNGAPAVDVIGHVDDLGMDDFDRRMANDRLNARTGTMIRAVALDEDDHRLWVADEYNNRVLGFQLDSHNRPRDERPMGVRAGELSERGGDALGDRLEDPAGAGIRRRGQATLRRRWLERSRSHLRRRSSAPAAWRRSTRDHRARPAGLRDAGPACSPRSVQLCGGYRSRNRVEHAASRDRDRRGRTPRVRLGRWE